jgi:hypothetical protein
MSNRFLSTILILVFCCSAWATKRYCTSGGSASNDGSTWANATSDIQKIINNSSSGDTVWVAAGTYYPNRKATDLATIAANDRSNAFVLKSGVKIFGGFAGTETSFSQRNISTNVTILSGDLGAVGTSTDNAYHVVISSGDDGTAELNGFTITKGYAQNAVAPTVNGNTVNSARGGGIYCVASSPTLSNLIISSNYADYLGGGINIEGASSPVLSYVTLNSNTSNQQGGGVYNTSTGTVSIINSTFTANGTLYYGGAVHNAGNSLSLTNILAYKNTSGQGGAAIYSSAGTPTIVNATIVYNTAASGYTGGLLGNFTVKNSILWGNLGGSVSNNVNGTITYNRTLLEGGTVSLPSIISNTNPRFVSVSTDNYQIPSWSPAVNMGDNSYNTTTTDLAGNTRTYDGTIDLGAYECQSAPTVLTKTRTIYVKKIATGTNDGSSWTNAFTELSDALYESDNSGTVAQIWVAADTYIPTRYAGNGSNAGDKSFVLQKDVAIYGGFAGTESSLSQRNWASNATILSGNSTMYHVIISAGDVGTAVLDGFSIKSGNAGSWGNNTVNGQTIEWSLGGGIFCSASSPVLSNLKIYSNTSISNGAAIYCKANSSPMIVNSLIYSNVASQSSGGVYSDASNPLLINCTVANNTGAYSGAGVNGTCVVKNSIIWNNTVSGSANNISGSITFNYSLVQNGTVSGTSIVSNSDPLFVNSGAGNYRLQVASSAKNIGNNSYLTALSVTTDLDGLDRFSSTVDLGAYEYRGIIYVKKGSTGTNGLSWGDALSELSDAITKANATNASVAGTITDIWVAAGTYYPTAVPEWGGTRDQAFIMPANIKVYGGFVGTESNVTQRDYLTNETILSGDLGADNSAGNNAYHVVAYSGNVGTAELNGFTIKDGYADDGATKTFNGNSINRNTGAGIVCHTSSPSLQNLKISNCYTNDNGAGVFCYQSSPTINNCQIFSNQAAREGGGIFITDSSAPYISNCKIYNNAISNSNGGGFKCKNNCNAQIFNCLFYGNTATGSGGAIDNDGGVLNLINSTIVNNSVSVSYGNGGGVFVESGNTLNIKNCIIWGNTVNGSVNNADGSNGSTLNFTTSLVESKTATGIISNSNPLFCNVGTNDYTLTKFSPAINKGTNSANALTTDLAGNTRIYNSGTIDLGAYEYQANVPTYAAAANGVLYVKKGATGGGSSWSDAIGELSDALLVSEMISGVSQIWTAAGTYYPDNTAGTGSTSRDKSFNLLSNIKLYGGFAGTETATTQRRISSHPSILSGDLGTVGDNSDNAYHVVTVSGSLGTASLDGFTITGGNANGSSNITINSNLLERNIGGGIFTCNSSVPFKNLTLSGNTATKGGGMYAFHNNAIYDSLTVSSNTASDKGAGIYFNSGTFTLQNSSLLSNTAQVDGGGADMYDWPNMTLKNLVIKSNIATTGRGGGLCVESVNTHEYYNLMIAQNQAGTYGGGIYTERYPTYNNITVAHNQAVTDGAGIYVKPGDNATINNAVVWGNRKSNGTINNNIGTITYNYSLVQGASLSSNSIVKNVNPLFLDSVGGDFRLKYNSPAINQGNNSYISAVSTDLAGNNRVFNSTVDLGAYEYRIINPVYVKTNATGAGYSWNDAMGQLSDAIAATNTANALSAGTVSEIWVAQGTYYPQFKAGSGSTTRDQAFVLPANVKIYGGFAATETLLSQRNWTNNTTILSGDLGVVGDNTDNSYHVVISAGSVGTAELNGFTITGANANASSTITVNGSNTINQNNGGGVFCANSSPILSNLIITNNSTSNKGGGAYFTGSSPTVSATTFSSNSSVEGGGLYNTNASPSISNSFFYSNTATNGAGIYNKTSSPTLTGDSIYSNTATTDGGGIYNASTSSPVLTNVSIYSNRATNGQGGGLYNSSSSPSLNSVKIHHNSAADVTNGKGGGIYNMDSSPLISNSFVNNNLSAYGAGLYNINSSLSLTGDSIFSNVASVSGGGMYNINASSTLTLTNVSIYSNSATTSYGGGIYNNGSSLTISGAKIHDNSANGTSDGTGGGVYILASSPVITNSHIYANSAKKGGGIYCSGSSPILTGDSIFSNSATTNGGGIHVAASSTATLTNVSIRNNTANSGGGIYNNSSSPLISNSKIYQNTAAQGSGFYNFGETVTAAPVLTNVYIILNTSTGTGGGFYTTGNNATHRSELVLKDVLIAGNTSTLEGGGIYNSSYTANTYTNVTLAGNVSGEGRNGGGMYNNTPANNIEVFNNSIIWGNKQGASTVSNIYNGTVSYNYCLFEGATLSTNSIISNSDPLFVNSSIGNYRIQGASSAYNAGDNTYVNTVSTDLDGANRIKYSTVDLGAYEFNQTNKWVGSVSTDPANGLNWSQGSVLANNDVLEFDASAQRDLLLTADKSITYLYNHSSRVLNANGHKLTLTGNINQSTAISASTAGSSVEFAGTANQSIPSGMFTNDSICNLIINNAANVTLSGSLHLANNITATIGKLDAYTNSPSVYYSGQLLDGVFTNNRAYNLTLYNTSGYAPASDLVVGNNLVIGRNVTLTLNPGVLVNVAGSITNNNGVDGLLIKSSPTGANGSLIFHNASNNPLYGTVEMYSKAFKDPNGPTGFKYKWQFFGIPLRSVQASPTFDGSYISEYNATSATSSWTSLANSALLTSFKGYEITQLAAKTISFQGILENADMNVNLAYNSGALYPGQHIISNPYTAAINIANISFTNCDGSVYQYNTGSKSDWSGYVGETTASNPGQYIASTPHTAGVGGIPATIPSMQGFLVKANAGGGNISYPYNSLTSKNSDPQRVKSNETATRVCAVVSVASAQYADKMWLFSDATCTNGFDAGWDAKKIRGTSVAPQLYAVEKDGEYQIDCKSTIVNTPICFKAGVDSVYSLKINGINLSQAYSTLYLVDSVANKVVSLQMDSTVYQFSATPNTSSTRFRIVESAGITTDSNPIEAEYMKGSFYVNGGKLYVAEKCAANYMNIYTATGKLIRCLNKNQLMAKAIDLQLEGGIYLLKSSDGEAKVVVVE